ncbi:MAG: hypothetical protein OXB88_09110 [Bacteriovoracales bacterium]|nr:hypothetical protein [Bacteriovoracales bacterium]
MKSLLVLSFLSLLSPFALAQNPTQEDKFSTLTEWFRSGDNISHEKLVENEDEIYVGRCYSKQRPNQAMPSLLTFTPHRPNPNDHGPGFPEGKQKSLAYSGIDFHNKASFFDFWSKEKARGALEDSLKWIFSLGHLEMVDYLGTLAIQLTFKKESQTTQSTSTLMPLRKFEDYFVLLSMEEDHDNSSKYRLQTTYSCYYFKAL